MTVRSAALASLLATASLAGCGLGPGKERTGGAELRARAEGGGVLSVRVRGYDDAGRGAEIEGAQVSAGGQAAATDASGTARLRLTPGPHVVRASKAGLVRSFGERVTVRP